MKHFNSIFFIALVLVGAVFFPSQRCFAKVKAWQGTVTIPTYGFKADINPKFWAMEAAPKGAVTIKNSITYPYTMQDDLSRIKRDRTYKALFLENEYLKITCLPELGGKFNTVFDKVRGEQMFYVNHVIKPSMIAMRGGGIIGGMAFNPGPQVHTTTNIAPVDALVGQNPDGSAYIEITNVEQMFRMRWTVRVTLYPGKSYMDETVRIFNPTDEMHPYYYWNNASLPNRKGSRFIYPMSMATFHSGREFFTWPIYTGEDTFWLKGCQGKDMTWLKNYETWAPIFAYKCSYDFFGSYDVDSDCGIVHVADRHQLEGKKAWTWGTWDFGLFSQQCITDEDGPYIEIQSGPLATQSDYAMLGPRQQVAWQEWWYPVHGLEEGFEYAAKDIAVKTTRKENSLELRMMATGQFPRAVCTISKDDKILLKETLSLSPKAPEVLTLTSAPKSPVNITIESRAGIILASFTTPLPIPKVEAPDRSKFIEPDPDRLTTEEKYFTGRKYDRATDRINAAKYYRLALADDPGHTKALQALAVLDIEAGLYKKAAAKLEKALDRDDSDGLSWFFLGVSHLKTNDSTRALDCAYRAAKCFGASSIGYDLAGRAHIRLRQHTKAVKAFQHALELNPHDTRTRNHLMLALYAAGDKSAAIKLAKKAATETPTDLTPRALLALRSEKEMTRFVEDARAYIGEDDFIMLETALIFSDIGLINQAGRLVKAVCIDAVAPESPNPIPVYYLAYFAWLQDDKLNAAQYLKQASRIYKDYAFPSRTEAVDVFEYALKENPDDAYGHLHLGNLYGDLGRLDKAAAHWEKAARLDPSLSIAFRDLALYNKTVKKDIPAAVELYLKAIAANRTDQTLYRDLADAYIADNQRPKAIELLASMPFETKRRDDVTIILAQAYLDENRYTEAIELLEAAPYFVMWEGARDTWIIFNKAHIERGKIRLDNKKFELALQDFEAALTYPENLNVGRLDQPEESPAQYFRGKALAALGRTEQARLAWQQGAALPKSTDEQNKYRKLCRRMLEAAK